MLSPLKILHDYIDEHRLWQKTITLKRGDYLHMAGDTDDNIYYVVGGTLQSFVLVNDEEQVIRFGYEGDFFTAIDSFIGGKPTMLYTRAIRKCTFQVVRKTDYLNAITKEPELMAVWQKIMSWMILGQLDREIDLLTNDPAERYRRVLERSPRLFQEIPAKYIANYLRMTAETLSRIRRS